MLEKMNRKSSAMASFLRANLFMILLFALTAIAFGQANNAQNQTMAQTETPKAETPKAVMMPLLQSYKEIKIGMTADEVKDKLGKPETSNDTSFYYEFSDKESVQIGLDADKKVRVISITYSDENAPKPEDVFGKEKTVTPDADGKIYEIVNYPEMGYWVAYSKTGGKNAMIFVTMQKL